MVHEWATVSALPPLGVNEVQIWRAELPDDNTPPEEYIQSLSVEERARAERLRAGRVRLQFVVARAVLRTLVGNCLSLAAQEVAITQSSFGKPETPNIFYNLAHSGTTILVALCRTHRLGIDVEYVGREVEALEIAKNSFTASEYLALSSIADEEGQRRAFFRCWTRKEAVMKADGRGLSLPLDSFEVPVGGRDGAEMVVSVGSEGPEASIAAYYVNDISCGDQMAAAWATTVPHCTATGFIFPLGMVARTG